MNLIKDERKRSVVPFGRIEWLIFGLTVAVGFAFSWYVYSLGLTTIFVDQNSHLNLSRQLSDSITPGISQLGFWPPLLHVLMAPFARINVLFMTGLAGAFVLAPLLGVAAVFLYRIAFMFVQKRSVAFVASLLFVLNPYVLYYASTPMMEILFMANLFGATYFLLQWLEKRNVAYITMTGLFVALASISRWEGFILLPLVGLILLADLVVKRRGYKEIEAVALLFSFMAVLGLGFVLIYGLIFGGDPLSFMNSNWSSFEQGRDYFIPTEGNVWRSFIYFLYASFHMLGKPQVFIAAGAFISALIVLGKRERFLFVAVSLMLFSPFVFDWLALVRGDAIVYVPELPPFNTFFNERFSLTWVGFVALVPVVFFGAVLRARMGKLIAIPTKGFMVISIIAVVLLNGAFLYRIGYVERYAIPEGVTARGFDSANQLEVAYMLQTRYDFGKVLITRAFNDFTTVNAGVPLKEYVTESNFPFYDQTVERPWLFARWVVMYNNPPTTYGAENDKVYRRWNSSGKFAMYYDLVLQNELERIYKVNDAAIAEYAVLNNLDLALIPSVSRDVGVWDPQTVYADMGVQNVALLQNIGGADIAVVESEPVALGTTVARDSGKGALPSNTASMGQAVEQYVVSFGDSLWKISERLSGIGDNWTEIARENGLRSSLIFPEQRLKVPTTWVTTQ